MPGVSGQALRRWWAIVTIVICAGAGWPESVWSAPGPGGPCTTEGRVKITKAGVLLCGKSGRRLQWVSIATVTTTTTTITTTTTTTTVPDTCAQDGKCVVGNTGPGGGKVFYVHPGGGTFASPGSDCGSSCRYLEAAPTDHGTVNIDGEFLPTPIAWCDNLSKLNVTATGIGSGMANTTTADTTCTSGAIQIAADYANNGKSDWHLPSKDELNEVNKQRATFGTRAEMGGLPNGRYWSSTELGYDAAFALRNTSVKFSDCRCTKSYAYQVRLVRAF